MAQLQHTTLFGNLIDIRDAGANKVLVLAEANFSKNGKTTVFDVMTFARHEEAVAELQAELDAVREAKGNAKAALGRVKVDALVAIDKNGKLQLQLGRVLKDTPVAKQAEAQAEA